MSCIVDSFNARSRAKVECVKESEGFGNTLVNTHEILLLLGGVDTTS